MRSYILLFFVFLIMLFSSCSNWLHPHRVYRFNKDTEFSSNDNIASIKEHVLQADDELSVFVMANNAEILINPLEFFHKPETQISFRVLKDGTVFLPGISYSIHVAGKPITEAENVIKEEYKKQINEPFVGVRVTNKRVFVHLGGRAGSVSTVELDNPNATLIEALSSAGGISEGRAKIIYLIRNTNQGQQFYKIDLSIAENAHLGNIVLQSNDVICVAPQPLISKKIAEDLTPFLTITTTFLLFFNLFK